MGLDTTAAGKRFPPATYAVGREKVREYARAVGETAPLIVIGALAYVPFVAESPMDEFTVLPIQIFNWVSRPQAEFINNAAAGILVLLVITLLLNGIAIVIRNRWNKKIRY